jgi:putative ABC transport system substrate-binding protein
MARLGWIEGRNLAVVGRVTGPDPDRRAEAISELVAAGLDLIVAGGTTDALPLGQATRTIPIVVIAGTDLVEAGLVDRLARPGRNVTGLTVIGRELDGKRLELVRELIPAATRVAMFGILNQIKTQSRIAEADEKARPLGLRVVGRILRGPDDLDAAFLAARSDGDQAVLVPFNAVTFENRPRLVAAATSSAIPTIYEFREYVQEGGLISYGAILADYFERAAALTDKILKGADPAELPVEQPTRFEMMLNRKAAQAIHLTVPPTLLARADEVIE